MRLRHGRAVVAALALVSMGLLAPAAVAATASAPVVSVHPEPYAPAQRLGTVMRTPPTTSDCEAEFQIACYQPAQVEQAYDLKPLYLQGLDGAGFTIVIVDAFGSPTIAKDLKFFDKTFGLADPPNFNIIQPAGTVAPYPQDPFGRADRSGWAEETTLDVEWSHSIAPGANILLVETPESETEGVQGFPQIVEAENDVVSENLGDVISQSFGATEETFPSAQSILDLRSAFVAAQQADVTVLAASGDSGSTDALASLKCCFSTPVTSWPPSDPLVTAVGGTQLHLDANGNRTAPDNVWNDQPTQGLDGGAGGGGLSSVFARPAFQNHVQAVVGNARGVPDISMSAAVDGGVVMYESFNDFDLVDPATGKPPSDGPKWLVIAGTSEATPELAGIVAIADQAVGHRLGDLNPLLYSHSSIQGIVDITSGNNTYQFCSARCSKANPDLVTVPGFAARPGYDLASGLGTVDAAKFVQEVKHLVTSQPVRTFP